MNVMSIDASTKSTGVAIFQDTKLIHYDCITASSTDLIKRIQKIVKGLQNILEQYDIDIIVLEEVRPEETGIKNLKTHKALMWLQAAIAFMVHDNFPKIQKIEYFYPSEWRAKCGIKTGRGLRREAIKQEDIGFAKQQYNIKIELNDDEADAINIGHAYVNHLSNELNWE